MAHGICACWKGCVGVVRLLLEEKADLDTIDTVWRVTPLHVAASCKMDLIVRQLIEGKAKLNVIGIQGDTPLSRAAGRGDVDVCKRLLTANANPDPEPVVEELVSPHSAKSLSSHPNSPNHRKSSRSPPRSPQYASSPSHRVG